VCCLVCSLAQRLLPWLFEETSLPKGRRGNALCEDGQDGDKLGSFFVLNPKSKGPQGCEYCLVCTFESSFSDFPGLATPKWFLPLMCSKVFHFVKKSLCCGCDVVLIPPCMFHFCSMA
jgi:hypothetical protein